MSMLQKYLTNRLAHFTGQNLFQQMKPNKAAPTAIHQKSQNKNLPFK
jgi:hypothetical protein